MASPSPAVLIVGAGPTGLLLAAELERRDVACLLIDALDSPQGWDRATVVHERSLQILEALGIADALVAAGVKTRGARFHSDGEVLGELHLDLTGTRYGYQLGVSEEVTESVLTEYLERVGGSVTRSTSLVGLRSHADSVTATIERDGERTEVTAHWVVGCDGHHSTVRELAGIDYPGTDIEAPWAVFDAAIEGWEADFDLVFAFFDEPPLIVTPLPGRRWRAYLRPTAPDADLVAEASEALGRYAPGASFVRIERPATFHCQSRLAERYRSGRVLLAGDAAHACTPSEGHGMNTGLQDAFNLGWKLALVCRGEAGEGLIDTYETERRPVAETVVGSGAAVEVAQAMTDAAERAERDAGIRATMSDPETAHHEAAAASEIDRLYPPSRAVAGADDAPVPAGVLLPDGPTVEPAEGAPRSLYELAHRPGHTLLVLGAPSVASDRVGRLAGELERHVGPVVEAVVGLGAIDSELAAQLEVTEITLLLVRPDRFIGLRDDTANPEVVEDYLAALAA